MMGKIGKKVAVIGGGAAGCFAAVNMKEMNPDLDVTVYEAENYKKLIVQYSTDPRVTVLKIADRLEVMRHLEMFPKLSRERKILETLMLYIPLAHQLGLYNIKSELEDIWIS